MKKNKNLKKLYNKIYSERKEKFFSPAIESDKITSHLLTLDIYKGKKILEVGCGTGETAYKIASQKKPESVLAIDYSREAIKLAQQKYRYDNLKFEYKPYQDISSKYDVIVMQEVLEHTDNPLKALTKLKSLLLEKGKMIITCPSFLNIRGYIWMSLLLLLDVPMSLTDLHYICPFDMEQWARKLRMNIEWTTINHSLGNEDKMILDMERRLTSALRDANLNNKNVKKLINWLKKAKQYNNKLSHTGAIGIYLLSL